MRTVIRPYSCTVRVNDYDKAKDIIDTIKQSDEFVIDRTISRKISDDITIYSFRIRKKFLESRNKSFNLLMEDKMGKNMHAARQYLYSINPNINAQYFITEIRRLLPHASINDGKYLTGLARMYYIGSLPEGNTLQLLDAVIQLIGTKYDDYYDRNLNGKDAYELIKAYFDEIKNELEKRKLEDDNQYDKNEEYTIIPITSFEQAQEYAKYNDWCISHSKPMYNNVASKYYFCLKNGFENVERIKGENFPLDEYGLSMIAVALRNDGSVSSITSRWNHDNQGSKSVMSEKELSELLGVNFYKTFTI